jgi:hypothetical protein
MPELAMGKGWRNAQKRSQDVTERVLAAARQGTAQQQSGGALAGAAGERCGAGELDLLADSLGLELLALLDDQPLAPSRVWLMAHAKLADRRGAAPASDALLLAERTVRSLLARGLVLLRDERGSHDGEVVVAAQQEVLLAAVETWAGGRQQVLIARKA